MQYLWSATSRRPGRCPGPAHRSGAAGPHPAPARPDAGSALIRVPTQRGQHVIRLRHQLREPVRQQQVTPTDIADVTGPGTAITNRPNCSAAAAVLNVPDRRPASTTTVPAPNAAINRFRTRNRCRAGVVPGGYSLTTAPTPPIASSSARFASGYARSIPQANTATVAGGTPGSHPPDAVAA